MLSAKAREEADRFFFINYFWTVIVWLQSIN